MSIDKIPEIYLKSATGTPDLFVYDFKMIHDVVKTKVNLSMNMFSFLQIGTKHVHFSEASVTVDKKQSLLIKNGNSLWSELLENDSVYICKLFFFSEKILLSFIQKYGIVPSNKSEDCPYFTIENDAYILGYLNSLSFVNSIEAPVKIELLHVKFEEILLYLIGKYGRGFENYLLSLVTKNSSPFKNSVESNVSSNLKLEEIAFLCNMSLSTFKRHFIKEYGVNPGKWLQDKRLDRAKKMMIDKGLSASEVYFEVGYTNLSNFSNAFKSKFGFSPRDILENT